jgi:peroxiredoxin
MTSTTNTRRGLTPRERGYAIGGALAALLAVAVIWLLTGRQAAAPLAVPEVNRPAPPFALPDLNGGTVDLASYRGKVVLVNFWNTWCEPCKEETPALQTAYNDLQGQGLVIIGVNLANQEQNGAEDVRNFTERYGVSYPIALDTDGAVSRAFRLYPLPTSFFIDAEGNIRYVITRSTTRAEVEALFNQLRQERS